MIEIFYLALFRIFAPRICLEIHSHGPLRYNLSLHSFELISYRDADNQLLVNRRLFPHTVVIVHDRYISCKCLCSLANFAHIHAQMNEFSRESLHSETLGIALVHRGSNPSYCYPCRHFLDLCVWQRLFDIVLICQGHTTTRIYPSFNCWLVCRQLYLRSGILVCSESVACGCCRLRG